MENLRFNSALEPTADSLRSPAAAQRQGRYTNMARNRKAMAGRLVIAALLLASTSCTSEVAKPFTMPTPGPSSLFILPRDATFRLTATVAPDGVRPTESTETDSAPAIDDAGYPSITGIILLAEVKALDTSAACGASSRDRKPYLYFGRRWTQDTPPDYPLNSGLPTRFVLVGDRRDLESIQGKTVTVWGTTPASGPCFALHAQFIDARPNAGSTTSSP